MTIPDPPPSRPAGPDRGLTPRNLRTAAIAFVVALTAGGLTLAMCSGGGGAPGKSPAADKTSSRPSPPSAALPAGPPAASSSPPGPAASSPAASSSPTAAPSPRVRWRGTVTVNGPRARRDLDQVPPRTSEHDGEADIRGDWLDTPLKAVSGARLALMKPRERPGALECRDATLATGDDITEPLDEGDVVCVATSSGRVARLITQHATMTSTAPELTFTVTVWDVPGAVQ